MFLAPARVPGTLGQFSRTFTRSGDHKDRAW